MAFGIGGNADLEGRDLADSAHQVRGISIAIGMRRESLSDASRRIATQRNDMADAGCPIVSRHRIDLGAARTDTGEVRGGRKCRFIVKAAHRIDRALARRPPGAIGHRNELRRDGLQLADGAPKSIAGFTGFWREEFEGHG